MEPMEPVKPKRVPRKAKAKPENKYEPKERIGKPEIGTRPVTKVGLGNLETITK